MKVGSKVRVGFLAVLSGFFFSVAAPAQGQVPGVPKGLAANPGNALVGLTWTASSGASSYHVKRSTVSGGPYIQIDSPTFAGYTDVSRTNGVTYYYVVSAVNSSGESANSTQVSAKPAAPVVNLPAAPAGLTGSVTNGVVGLRWNPVTGASSYHVKRSTISGGPYTQIGAPTWQGYSDVGVTNGNSYYYVVSTVSKTGEGANSAQVSVTVGTAPPPAPTVNSVTISPATASSLTSGTLPFTATVNGTVTNKTVTWKAARGTISSTGSYKAPSTAGTDTVTATSVADTTKSASTAVTVTALQPPPTNPPPTTNPPPPTSGFPISFFGQSISQIQASHFPTVSFGGVRLWDTNTTWAQIETSQGSYNWTELDAWLRSVSSHGKDSMYTFGRVPTWASMRPTEACPYSVSDPGCAAPPSDVDSGDAMFKAFVTALVKHSLSSPELHISYYEMWNEPDLKRNWTGTAAQLVTLQKDAYTIIHSLDPNAKLVGPGASTANQYGVHYLPDLYAAGGATYQDIVGLHAYLYGGSSFATSPAAITTSISQLQKLMATYGISSKPIWFTEGNWNGDGGGTMTDAQKAAYLAQEHMLMWSTGAVSRYYWYSWDSQVGTLWIASKGLTPAGTAYNQLTEWLIGSTNASKPCTTSTDGTWTCSLVLATGYPAQIIWNANTSETHTVGTQFATYRTLTDGNVHSITNHQVAIGALPVMVIGTQLQ
jgi:fibronectin type 3 domain-containing protein